MLLAIALGGAAGTIARYGIGVALAGPSERFPVSTLLINVVGSFIIGWALTEVGVSGTMHATTRATITVGFCGGFTTFSGFSFETVRLLQRGETGRAITYVVLSVLVCLAATVAGMAAARIGTERG